MIKIEIPGNKIIQAEHLVLDYNGTLAVDGTLLPRVKEILNSLAEKINVHIVTADTFGLARDNLKNVRCQITILSGHDQQQQKLHFINRLGEQKVIAMGNGFNDMLMLKDAALGIVVLQKEGASAQTLLHADIVCPDIICALYLLRNPLRIAATLRD